jgi:hypothetical protein
MFRCRGCEALKSENARLHAIIERLLDTISGPALPADKTEPEEPTRISPFEQEEIKNDKGEVVEIVERFGYGTE